MVKFWRVHSHLGKTMKIPYTRPPVVFRAYSSFVNEIPSLRGTSPAYLFLVMYWNYKNPMDSVVELQYQHFGDKELRYIDPNFMRSILADMPSYRDAIVDIAPGRTFFKGLCGEHATELLGYDERLTHSLAGRLVADHNLELAVSLTFPNKVKSMYQALRVLHLIGRVSDFAEEMGSSGTISTSISQVKERMSRIRETIDAYDTYISEDYKTLDSYVEVLRRFGIEYDMSGLENSNN